MYQSPFSSSVSQPVSSKNSNSNSSSNTAEKISGTVKKEIIDILKESGIPSDVNLFLTKANNFLKNSTSLSNMSLFGGTNSDYDISHLIVIQQMANDIKFNKAKFDSAEKNLNDQEAWGDIALDSRGYMYVINTDGNIETVRPENFDIEKQQALTNQQILGLRERSETFAMDSVLLNNLEGAVGMKTIQEYLLEIVEKLGMSSTQGYISKEQGMVIDGIKELISGGPEGYYKIKSKSPSSDIKTALQYLYSQLTRPMKQVLNATIAAEGGDPSKDRYRFIGMMVSNHLDFEQSVDFEKGDGSSAKTKDSESKASVKDTLAEKYASGSGAPPPRREILMTANSGTPLFAYTQNLGAILNSDGKSQLGNANLLDVFTNGYGMAMVDKQSITFGDMLINPANLSKIVYDSSTNLRRVYLPARSENGRIVPDFKLAELVDTLNTQARENGYTPDQIRNIIQSEYPSLVYDEATGLILAKNSKLFFTFGAIASDDTYGSGLENSNWLIPQSDEVDEAWKDEYNKLISYRTNKSFKEGDETGNPETDWWWGYKFYKGNVFVPVSDPMLASTIYNDQYWPKDVYVNMTQQAEAIERSRIREQTSNLITNF